MPELPEVETTLRGIVPHILHHRIKKIIIRQYQLRWKIPSDIHLILVNKTLIGAERRGKYILLKTTYGAIIIHLGMSGHLKILTKNQPHRKHDHVDLIFSNNIILRFTDPRRFGAFLWVEGNPFNHSLLKDLGVEPLSKNFSASYLFSQAQNKTTAIKSLIMNSNIVTGIGNIYAAEALFKAGIHPETSAKSLSIERLQLLVKAIKKILRHAIKKGGTTLKDFSDSDGKPGYFSHQLKVYGREGLACIKCHSTLQSIKIGQRSTVYCKRCQT
ncbi:MAG: bifunctional DNA-formamidopyrimidine glycosylase/DNA-(apurinic or apyrimidinic site) lyase [Gammaproteobacteria bacterium]|nr:bifunctional DNA-formamidopyrimidine glycosylase/DNA-(apurinic or apyrimidinic site) lyase [Gammaproteobacteria bacterium]